MDPTPTQKKLKKGKTSKEELIQNTIDARTFQEEPLIKDQDFVVAVDADLNNIGGRITYWGNVGAFLDRIKIKYVTMTPNGKQRVQTAPL